MTETVIEAFERMAREHLTDADLSVQHRREPSVPIGGSGMFEMDERTEIAVTHYGDPDALERLEDAHTEAIMSSFYVETREMSPALDSDETVRVAEADFVLNCDPHEEYVSGGAGASVSGSGTSASASPEPAEDGHEDASTDESEDERTERAWGDGLENPPEPSMELSAEDDGTVHVLADTDGSDGGEDFHVCKDVTVYETEPHGNVKDLYDSLLLFAADPDLCETCARTVILFYNLPEGKVMDTMEAEYDG